MTLSLNILPPIAATMWSGALELRTGERLVGSFFFSFRYFGVTGQGRPSSAGCVSCSAAWALLKCLHRWLFFSFFKADHCGSAKLGVDLRFPLHLSVNKQSICFQSCTDTERLMFVKLFRTSWDSALHRFCPNNDFQIKPAIRLLIRPRELPGILYLWAFKCCLSFLLLVNDQHKHMSSSVLKEALLKNTANCNQLCQVMGTHHSQSPNN